MLYPFQSLLLLLSHACNLSERRMAIRIRMRMVKQFGWGVITYFVWSTPTLDFLDDFNCHPSHVHEDFPVTGLEREMFGMIDLFLVFHESLLNNA